MDSRASLMLFAKLFTVISWPSFTLVCPVYASYMAMKSDCDFKKQQCLTYWVLFSLITMFESLFGQLFTRLPFWHYIKGMATVFLLPPYLGGAASVYKNFVKPCISDYPVMLKIFFYSENQEIMKSKQNKYPNEDKKSTADDVQKETAEHTKYEDGCDHLCNITKLEHRPPTSVKAQKEWSCALCLVSTTSEKCLKKHNRGKKHFSKVQEQKAEKLTAKASYKYSFTLKRTNSVVMFENLSDIVKLNLVRWGDFIRPVTRQFGWCIWKKPELGWIKLNTDGSVTQGNSSFGGLLRDCKGVPVCAFVSKAQVHDIFLVELWAVWRGLVLAASLGIKVILIESDSMSVVNTINRKQSFNPKAASCLKCIWKLLKTFEKYQVSHLWREANRAADHLSKMSLTGNDVVLWPGDFPASLTKIINDDAQGRVYHRG